MIRPYQPTSTREIELAKRWLEARMPEEIDLGGGMPLLFVENGNKILCCVYWHNFTKRECMVSIAADSPRWATKGHFKLVISYPFLTWREIERVSALTEKRNRRARKLLKGVGFFQEGVHPAMFRSGAGISFGMTRGYWASSRWSPEVGQVEPVAA